VGHYTSPHILKFNERIWLDGADASDAMLEAAHERLYGILGQEVSDGLSYFEYTTLLAFVVFEDCDLMVLEAGLGGEYDATNVCDKALSVITPIGIDHQAFLGETIGEIASTKIRSIQTKALLAPQPYDEVPEIAREIADTVGVDLRVCPGQNNRIGTSWVNTRVDPYVERIAQTKAWPDFLIQNARVAMAALDILDISYDVDDLSSLELFGRFYPWRENVRIDVGHNPLAARALVDALKPDTVLIYHALDDKDYDEVLRVLQPKLKRVEIIRIDSQRATTQEAIETALKQAKLPYRHFDGTINDDEHYLVFGSFYVVEAFLRNAVANEL
jgi:dihydrofolate synthase/folylpolyglutamate synthase